MWADQFFHLDLPYAELWVPAAIGLGVGGMCVLMGRQVFGWGVRQSVPPPAPKEAYYDPFEKGSATEHRKVPRRGGNPTEVFYAPPDKKDRPVRAWVIDRSVAGICLWLGETMAPGTLLSILPVNATSVTPWIDIEVCNCRAQGNGYEVGCKFVKSPPSLILMQFG